MIHRTLFALLIAVALVVICSPPESRAQDVPENVAALERQLNQLAEKGFPGPVVAVLWTPPPGKDAKEDPTSLEEVAEASGLKLFEQDDVYVLGPAQRRDFTEVFSDTVHQMTPIAERCALLVHSLDDAQWWLLGSEQGLRFGMLRPEQQAMARQIFASGNVVVPVGPDGNQDLAKAIPADTMPLHESNVFARLEVSYIRLMIRLADGRYGYSPSPSISTEAPVVDCWVLRREPLPAEQHDPLRLGSVVLAPPAPNTLKTSDLHYGLSALSTPVSMSGRTNLRDLVAVVARQTGLKLYTSPGSGQIRLLVSASSIPAGRLLKAVSLATTGTWRAFGDGYVFAFDTVGIGQIWARVAELGYLRTMRWVALGEAFDNLITEKKILRRLPFAPGSTFTFSPEQLDELWRRRTQRHPEDRGIPWDALAAEQRDLVPEKLYLWLDAIWPDADEQLRSVEGTIRIRLGFDFPHMGPVFISGESERSTLFDLLPSRADPARAERFFCDAAPEVRLPLTAPLRACIWKPSRRDKVANVVSTLKRHGFNTLYLKVFTDGYTVFPSDQFPQIAGLDPEYLPSIISLAHAKGIKVFGVVDVLRWSDGRKRHWLSKRPDLLDYDILGRTLTQRLRILGSSAGYRGALKKFVYGEAVTGDAVTPFSAEAWATLRSVLKELASYDLDGLVLDHTWMMRIENGVGMLGHSGKARRQFFLQYGADSIDITPQWLRIPAAAPALIFGNTPLQPIISPCYRELPDKWRQCYRERCDDLLDDLIKKWSEAKTDSPVWVTDSFGAPARLTHDWSRFKGRLSGVLCPVLHDGRQYAEHGLMAVPVFRACERLGTLMFATVLAEAQHQKLGGETVETGYMILPATEGIVIDLTCAGRKKSAYLRLILPPEGR